MTTPVLEEEGFLSVLEELIAGELPEKQKAIQQATNLTTVSAGAGTGKTETLSMRFAGLLLREGVKIQDVLTLTFTEKAAHEMSERIFKRISAWLNSPLLKNNPKAAAVLKEVHSDWSLASWALLWVRKLPGVQVVLSGMSTLGQLQENIEIFSGDESLSDEDEKQLFKACEVFSEEISVACTACLYCCKECSAKIDISKMLEIYNLFKIDGEYEIVQKINDSDSRGKPVECTGCGVCESHCPQKIEIVKIMKELAGLQRKKA